MGVFNLNNNRKIISILREDNNKIANYIVDTQIKTLDFSQIQIDASISDAKKNIENLANAIEINSKITFDTYVVWLRNVLRSYDYQDSMLIEHFQLLKNYILNNYDLDVSGLVCDYINSALESILNEDEEFSFIANCGEFEYLANDYINLLIAFKKNEAVNLILDQVNSDKISIEDLYINVFTNVLYEVGRLWQNRTISVGQEHYSTAVTQYIMSILYDKIFTKKRSQYKMIGICVGDELHEVGIRMVCDIFEMKGWDSYYLGASVPLASILSEIDTINPNVLALSVTINSGMGKCIEIINKVKSAYPDVKIIVGGRAFNIDSELWEKIGANGYSFNAIEAIKLAKELVGDYDGK